MFPVIKTNNIHLYYLLYVAGPPQGHENFAFVCTISICTYGMAKNAMFVYS